MVLKKRLAGALAVFSVGLGISVHDSTAATLRAASPAYDHVNAAVAAAQSGDTVVVPAGTATWTTTLTISKRIWLRGAGPGQTVIAGGMGLANYIIRYSPTDSVSASYFRLTGFTFNANNNSRFLRIYRSTVSAPTYVRIDNNRFIGTMSITPAFVISGVVYGVVDNNTFDNGNHHDNYGLQDVSWQNLTFVPGSPNNLYYEDNTFNICVTADSGGHGGRYALRYNTYNLQDPTACGEPNGYYPLFDAHGNQPGGIAGTMGIEIYGNRIVGNYTMKFLTHRGGKAVVFSNKVISSAAAGSEIWEEYDDSISPPSKAADGTPEHVNNAYYWNNRKGLGGTALFRAVKTTDLNPPVLSENIDYLNHTETFDGTSGVGCGPLAERPTTCSVGVAYWATTQTCSSVDDSNVGANPATPLSGTLYKCTAPNIWSTYFRPFTYPHPFRATELQAPTSVIVR